ncbi:hypothetical protein QUF80_17185 [Desulfococcaceae bacterium HSG8]|nr:hypothetical protein [Desulfococcaceae bacterium HSG8]
MKTIIKMAITGLVVLSLAFPTTTFAAEQFSIKPTTNNGKKWRIGYRQGGNWINYTAVHKATIRGLMELGWIKPASILHEEDSDDAGQLWKWMVANLESEYLKFVPDAFWSANWTNEVQQKNNAEIIRRLNTKKDIDLMFAFGTWAGLDMASNEHSTPTVIMSVSDPIRAKIIKSAEDSGYDHIHARVDPHAI